MENQETDVSKFSDFFSSKYNLDNLSRKLQSQHEFDFGEFIKELNKAIKLANKARVKEAALPNEDGTTNSSLEAFPALTKKDEFEWIELFEENKKKAQGLQRKIEQTEREIDAMVYELYGLTEEEIAIVEGS